MGGREEDVWGSTNTKKTCMIFVCKLRVESFWINLFGWFVEKNKGELEDYFFGFEILERNDFVAGVSD